MSPSNNDTQHRPDRRYAWGICGFLLMAIGLVFGQTLGHVLLDFDDSVFVTDNPHVSAGLTGEGIRWAFAEGPFGEWYPLSMLSHMFDCQVYGLNAWGHHLTNVLLHAATSIALFLVLWRLTGELWPSAFVATVFAIHPQHVESVAWVAERKDVLSGLFFVLTLGAYLGYVRHGRSLARYVPLAALFALGLLAKPMVVTLPAILLLLDFWPLARIGAAIDTPGWAASLKRPGIRGLVLEKLPLFALSAGDCLMTLRTHITPNASMAWTVRIGNAAVSCVDYVIQFVYPVGLAAHYPIPAGGPPTWKVIVAVAILSGVTGAAVIWRRRCPYCFVGWFWYLGMLSPVLGLVKIGALAMADRYMYLPGIGLYIAVAWGATRIAARSLEGRWMLGTCAVLAIAILVVCAAWQASFWRDDETLWKHALACTTSNGEAEFGLGNALAHQGRLDSAIIYYRRAAQHAPDFSLFNNLGLALAQQGKLDEAIAEYRHALAIKPDAFLTHANLGAALMRQNRYDEAFGQFQTALAIDPRNVPACINLARLLAARGQIDEAKVLYRRALDSDPNSREAREDLDKLLGGEANRP